MSPINEMTPMAPQAHFNSEPAFGFISQTRLVTTSKAKRNTVHRGGGTFDLITGESLHAGAMTWTRSKPLPFAARDLN
jgi:hypothetical protein